jgi:pyruvate dehydrogenase E1 component
LQHQDGTSQLIAATIPNCRAYDPCYAAELAWILDAAIDSILHRQEDVFYYLTVSNENLPQISLPDDARQGVLRGMYRLSGPDDAQVRLLGSGAMLAQAQAAATVLEQHFGVLAQVYSVTSFSLLAREGMACERAARLGHSIEQPWVTRQLSGSEAPVIAAADYVRAVPESIRAQVPARYITLGCDGFGRSDTRARLRDFFEVDARWIAHAALHAMGWDTERMRRAAQVLELDLSRAAPWTV